MKTAIATRFRCRSPLTNFNESTLMFLTLIPQYLNELVKCEVRDFTSPKPFHAVKIQSFKDNPIKLLREFAGELPLKVFALVADFPIETGDLSHALPPAVRTFYLSRKAFVERAKFLQVRFQGVWVLDLLTRAKRQICVFHTGFGLGIDQIHSLYYIVCPNALTCCRQPSKICVGRCYTKPIGTATITFDGDTTDTTVPLAVFVKRIWHSIKLPLTRIRIPFAKSQCDTIVFHRPTRGPWIGDRFELMSRLNMRSATKFLEKTIVCIINTHQLLLHRLTRQYFPVRVRRPFQRSKVIIHGIIMRIRQPIFIALTLPVMEILMHLPHVVKQIANTYGVRLFSQRIFIGFHGISSIKFPLTPFKWVGRHATLRSRLNCLPT